ncbi:MAG: hypothetical protein AB1896_20200 [Thermodesulfobacteriota bacterium]
MTLYTKVNCVKCDKIKERFDLNKLGVRVKEITQDDPEVLADLAWHELLDLVEKGALPILLLNDGSVINYYTPIRRYLEKNCLTM